MFVKIYRYFSSHKALMWSLLVFSVILMGWFASKLHMQMDVTSFLPQNDKTEMVFNNLKITDRIVVMISSETAEVYDLMQVAEDFKDRLWASSDSSHILSLTTMVETENYDNTINYIYDNLPLYMEEADYQMLDSLLNLEACNKKMHENYEKMISPIGVGIKDIILRDPLGVGNNTLFKLSKLNPYDEYAIFEDYIFSKDYSTLYVFIESTDGANASDINDELTTSLENTIEEINSELDNIEIDYFGTPAVAAYNVRQVYEDLILTLTIAIVTISLLISFVYKKKRTIIFLIAPVLYGFLFSLSIIYLVSGTISAIAIGTGSIILGVALSYSIHVISHSYYTKNAEELIRELSYPLTVGSITTIGAFIGLLFTNSSLLQDFGLFAAGNIIGTTIFCLIFLPHFLPKISDKSPTKGLKILNKINDYPYDRNKYLIGGLVIITAVALFHYNDVGFDSDIMNLNYMPEHLEKSKNKLESIASSEEITLVVSHSTEHDEVIENYKKTDSISQKLTHDSYVKSSISVAKFLFTQAEQQEKIDIWNNYWTTQKKTQAKSIITLAAVNNNFKETTFSKFTDLLDKEFMPKNMLLEMKNTLFSTFIENNEGNYLLTTHISVNSEDRDKVYPHLDGISSIIDRSYFIGVMADDIKDNFNLILSISSALIFIVLLFSYGRLELALLAFLPMCLSWVIILGFMSILSVEFNIVSIILSTFIFGIGDDFSIFVLDGLINDYKYKKRTLLMHKTAIFFSALMTILGMGVLVFAKHPAIHSLGLVSLLGIVVVVLVSYILQPLLFRIFISSEAIKRGLPHSIGSILRTIIVFLTIGLGCILLPVIMFLSLCLPIKFDRKKLIFRKLLRVFAKLGISSSIGGKCVINRNGEDFKKPAIIVANHQSLVDLLMVFSINPSIVVVTQNWVYSSPLFGLIVRIAGYLPANSGIENIEDKVGIALENGLSVLIFPEGTRSRDLKVHRFHKGAFYLAEKFKVDIIPAVLYGSGMIFSKNQPQYVAPGYMRMDLLPRISPEDNTFGVGYRERTKNIREYVAEHLEVMKGKYDNPENRFYQSALMKQFIYKDVKVEYSVYLDAVKNTWYKEIEEKVGRNAVVLDLNCGYGALALMLSITSEYRQIYAYSPEKEDFSIAQNSVLGKNIRFYDDDIPYSEMPECDVIIFHTPNTVLSVEEEKLLNKYKKRLSGVVIIKNN